MQEQLEKQIRKIIGEKLFEPDIQQLLLVIAAGKDLMLATEGKTITITGSANNTQNIIGDHNIVIQIPALDTAEIETLTALLSKVAGLNRFDTASVDDLVQQIRTRLYDDIYRLHGTMPLLGIDYSVPFGKLFVNINILEEVSRNRRAELADLWRDFNQSPGDRSLDRIGLGKARQQLSGLEILSKGVNLMVVGKPGSGKSTYLQRVVTEGIKGSVQGHRVPTLIKLREFVDDGREIAYSIERYLEQYWQLSEAETALVLREGRALVLVDGLDEVIGEDRQAIAKQIKRFNRTYPQVQIIVTCRTQSQESRFDQFDYVEVADFNEPQVRAFAKHWFQAVCKDIRVGQSNRQAFLEQLFRAENKSIRELAITPILLSLTCAVFYQTGKFYSKRFKLYEEGLFLLLEQWDKRREVARDEIYRDLSVERKLELLSYLALEKFEKPQYVLFEQSKLETNIVEFLGTDKHSAQAVLKAIEAQHGLLIERASGVWSFSHLTFQEYFAALEIGRRQEKRPDAVLNHIEKHLHNSRWSEVLLLLIAQQDQAQAVEALNTILCHNSPYEQWLHRDLLFAGRVLSEGSSIDQHTAIPLIQTLINLSFDEFPTTTKKTRQLAKDVLCALGLTPLAPVALQLLDQMEPSLTSWEHIHYRIALGKRAQTIAFLEEQIRRSSTDIDTQFFHSIALLEISPCSRIGEDGLLNVIKRRASADCLYESMGNEVQAISQFSNYFLDELLSLAETDTIFYVDLSHVFSFLCGCSDRMLDGLIALTTNKYERFRAYAIEVLVDYCTLGRATQIVKRRVSHILIKALRDASPKVRISAVYGLRHWEFDEFLKPFINEIQALLTDTDQQVQYTAASSLINLGVQGEGSAEIIISGIEKIAQDIASGRTISTQSRSEYWLPDSFYTGTQLLDHSDALISRLERLLGAGDPVFQTNIFQILSNLSFPSEALIDRVYLLTESVSSSVKTPALNTWAKLHVNRQKSLGQLEQCLLHDSSEVKVRAIAIIEKEQRVSSKAISWLKQLIQDSDIRVKLAIVKAISTLQIDDTPTMISLLQFLEYEGPQTKAPQIAHVAARTLIELSRSNQAVEAHLVEWIEKNINRPCVGSGIDVLRAIVQQPSSF